MANSEPRRVSNDGATSTPPDVGLRRQRAVLVAAIALIAVASLAVKLQRVSLPFVETRAWVSAHFSIMARNYAEHGFWALHFAPVQSTGPLEPRPDYYLHWPFLFPLALGVWFKALGVSE